MITDEVRLCRDCKWRIGRGTFAHCSHTVAYIEDCRPVDLITGKKADFKTLVRHCSTMRENPNRCGEEGKYFEWRPPVTFSSIFGWIMTWLT